MLEVISEDFVPYRALPRIAAKSGGLRNALPNSAAAVNHDLRACCSLRASAAGGCRAGIGVPGLGRALVLA